MKRYVEMSDISDGKKYSGNDMAKLGCNDCQGCSACCSGMGESIILDPWDIYMLTTNRMCTFEALLEREIALQVVDGIILPHIKLDGENQKCSFLNLEGRCTIHSFRPGLCRLFPLGRWYEKESFSYFLQINECQAKHRTKVKINKWLGIQNLAEYEKFILEWHNFILDIQKRAQSISKEKLHADNMYILQFFFVKPYRKEDFYKQFSNRMSMVKRKLEI